MSKLNSKEIYQVTWLIRRAFRLMGVRVDQYLKDLNISACERSVIECLYPDQQLSVPQIAEFYDVSRQHIQSSVNPLLEKDVVELKNNPKHKRSPLVTLTSKGTELFREIRRRDENAFIKIFSSINKSDAEITLAALKTLVNSLSAEIKQNHLEEK